MTGGSGVHFLWRSEGLSTLKYVLYLWSLSIPTTVSLSAILPKKVVNLMVTFASSFMADKNVMSKFRYSWQCFSEGLVVFRSSLGASPLYSTTWCVWRRLGTNTKFQHVIVVGGMHRTGWMRGLKRPLCRVVTLILCDYLCLCFFSSLFFPLGFGDRQRDGSVGEIRSVKLGSLLCEILLGT